MEPTNSLAISMYLHCGECLAEVEAMPDESPQSYSRLSVGFTDDGLQIFCERHEINVAHFNFEGHMHPVNTTKAGNEEMN